MLGTDIVRSNLKLGLTLSLPGDQNVTSPYILLLIDCEAKRWWKLRKLSTQGQWINVKPNCLNELNKKVHGTL